LTTVDASVTLDASSFVATALFVSVRTIESHVVTIYRKLGVHSRAELARRFARTALPHDVGQ
jgi:DNA-binding NarL/FixJ family response regulator